MKFLIVGITAICFLCCTNRVDKPIAVVDKLFSQVPDTLGASYFPPDSMFFSSVRKSGSLDSFVRDWYSDVLYKLKEPVLYSINGKGESIRLAWLRPFNNPVVVRLNNFDDTVYVNVKELELKSNSNDVPEIVVDTLIVLDHKKWKQCLSMLNDNGFWNAVTEDTSSNFNKDLTSWFLESKSSNRYHCITRSDDGDLSSKDLNLYAGELVKIARNFVTMGRD